VAEEKIRLSGGSGFEAAGGDVDGCGSDFRDARFGVALSDGGMGFGGGFRRERADSLVAAGVLGFVEGAVGESERFFIVHFER